MRHMLKILTLAATMAAMLAVSAMPAAAFEYGGYAGNGFSYGSVRSDVVNASGYTLNSEFYGSESSGSVSTGGMKAQGFTYSGNSNGFSYGYLSADGMSASGYADKNGNQSGIVRFGDVCFGSCPQ